jgi:hypothetical protein
VPENVGSGVVLLERRSFAYETMRMTHQTDNYDGFDLHSEKRESRERPFDYTITINCADLGAQIGMRPEENPGKRAARNSLLANLALLQHVGPDAKLFYSRANDAYARHSQYAPGWFTRRVVTQVIDGIVEDGWAMGHKIKPSPHATKRSTIWPTAKLKAALAGVTNKNLRQHLSNVILLRDKTKTLIPYSETSQTRAMRREVEAQNELLANVTIAIGGLTKLGLYNASNGRLVNTLARSMYRVFNHARWDRGGRYYGGWWQQLPREDRGELTMDGSSVFEHDIGACHLRMAFARVAAAIPQTDPYQINGLSSVLEASDNVCRSVAKQIVLILINAETAPSAHRAISGYLSEAKLPGAKAKAAVAVIKASMPDLKPVWHTGLGLELQFYDSEVAMRVMRAMRKKGVPVLPVHDSFIVPSNAEQQLKEVVEREFNLCLSKLRRGA